VTLPETRAKCLGARASRPHKLWHSRGYLPHFDQPGLVQSISFRLQDSLPRDVVQRWKQELGWHEHMATDDGVAVELRERITHYEDEGHGECYLARADIGGLVENALLHFDADRYGLLAWCVMPNHVHGVIETHEGYPLGEVIHSWKSFTAKEANKLLERRGDFWMPDYHDRFIRDDRHLAAVIAYIENNPVTAGLVDDAVQWPFSSAGMRHRPAGETPTLPGLSERQ
jgi:REP element-mobilizing transposase RayT